MMNKEIKTAVIHEGTAILITSDGRILQVYYDPKQHCFYLRKIEQLAQ